MMRRESSKDKHNRIIQSIYRVLYANSEPTANWDELVENAPLDARGRKIIPYDNYEIDGDIMDSLIDSMLRHENLTKNERQIIRFNVYLGCSPKTKIRFVEEDE